MRGHCGSTGCVGAYQQGALHYPQKSAGLDRAGRAGSWSVQGTPWGTGSLCWASDVQLCIPVSRTVNRNKSWRENQAFTHIQNLSCVVVPGHFHTWTHFLKTVLYWDPRSFYMRRFKKFISCSSLFLEFLLWWGLPFGALVELLVHQIRIVLVALHSLLSGL